MTLTDKIYKYLKSGKGKSSRQILLFADGVGDPSRLVRFLQAEGKVISTWIRRKIKGKIVRHKIYKGV